ncbi:MAG: hypothetical protein U0031_00100 [Thermomicrobiales bacterium]
METVVATGTRGEARREVGPLNLDAVGVHNGTDLSSLGRDCLSSCERFFAPVRDDAFDLLEIGVGSGASLRTWREWFPRARLTGLDARRIHLDPPIANTTIEHGNQADPAVLHHLVRGREFRVVIDDGSHRADDQIQTFLHLFPWLAADAIYVSAGLGDGTASGPEAANAAIAWFAAFGGALVDRTGAHADFLAQPGVAVALHRASGVYLAAGCAIVTA